MAVLIRAVILAIVLTTALPPSASGQARADESLARRVDSLERRILELERRIAQLEGAAAAQPARDRATSGNSRDLANWRRLREDMTYEQVRAILGEPDRVDGGGVAFWYYPRGGRAGFVSGRLSSWQEPDR